MSTFFDYHRYRDFLQDRFASLKAANSAFSARAFAKRAGLSSPAYFNMVVRGERCLTRESAIKFAAGLCLDSLEKEALLCAVDLERSEDPKERKRLLSRLESLKRRAEMDRMNDRHLQILADPDNLKLYLLAQSTRFSLEGSWLAKKFRPSFALAERVSRLLETGLWRWFEGKVETVTPTITSGSLRTNISLRKTHENLLKRAEAALDRSPDERILGSRTFLVDKRRMNEIAARIEDFKQQIESEFEELDSDDVYTLHVSFYPL